MIMQVLNVLFAGGQWGNAVKGLVAELEETKRAEIDARNTEAHRHHVERIKDLEGSIALAKEDAKHATTAWVRPAISFVFLTYLAKVVLWDKVLGLGTTDPLSSELQWGMNLVMTFYYGGRVVEKVMARK